MKDLLLIVGASILIAWFMMVPFPNFLSQHVEIKEEIKLKEMAPVQYLPEPIRYNETEEEQII